MGFDESHRDESTVLMLSIFAVLVAVVLSMATISGRTADNASFELSDPYAMASAAAYAGLDAAKWHIECHGRTEGGSLTPHYHINGAVYSVEWDDVNLGDSTVIVRSYGIFRSGQQDNYSVNIVDRIKLEFLPAHRNEILTSYYARDKKSLGIVISSER